VSVPHTRGDCGAESGAGEEREDSGRTERVRATRWKDARAAAVGSAGERGPRGLRPRALREGGARNSDAGD